MTGGIGKLAEAYSVMDGWIVTLYLAREILKTTVDVIASSVDDAGVSRMAASRIV